MIVHFRHRHRRKRRVLFCILMLFEKEGEIIMAMNKNLKEGSILLYYPEITEVRGWSRRGQPAPLRGYNVSIHVLYVYSRRARTNGTWLPISFKPLLDSLSIRTNQSRYGRENEVQAIGCNTRRVYTTNIGVDDDIPKEFIQAFKQG